MSSPLVSFLIAGVQKAGTTALFDYLQDHDRIGFSAIKEPHFFDDETVDWSKPDYTAYHELFPRREEALLFGEATPVTIYWPNAIARAIAYNPDMKFIIMLRNPVERAFSHWRMEKSRGAEAKPFSWCIREGRSRVNSKEAPDHHLVYSYVERGFYAEQLGRFLENVPRSQALFLDAEGLAENPIGQLNKISMFLGVPTFSEVEHRRVHEAAKSDDKIAGEDYAYLREVYREDTKKLRDRFGIDHNWFGAD